MFAGRSLAYEQLLLETAAEVDVLAARRQERDARLLERAQKEIREAHMRLAVVAQSRAPGSGDVEQEFRSLALGLPSWHPEHPGHPENDL